MQDNTQSGYCFTPCQALQYLCSLRGGTACAPCCSGNSRCAAQTQTDLYHRMPQPVHAVCAGAESCSTEAVADMPCIGCSGATALLTYWASGLQAACSL
jgi:hypothetical protein